MLDIAQTALFVYANTEFGEFWTLINYVRYRFGFIR